jgi:alanyl-tRNA synthetase
MMISDGVLPSNEGRGYVLRRLLRRAARHGRLLGAPDTFLHRVVDTVIAVNEIAYPELRERRDYIIRVVKTEEESFNKTLDTGMELLSGIIAASDGAISGADAFRLYDTYGFPIDLTIELAAERGVTVDTDGFNELMAEQRKRARAARLAMGDFGWEGFDFSGDRTETKFLGYDALECEAEITHIIVDGALTDTAIAGQEAIIVLDKTPFYAEMGGQAGDRGEISFDGGAFDVTDTQKTKGGKYLHHGAVQGGSVKAGSIVCASVDAVRRSAIRRAHSATHLLHAALIETAGEHIHQAGSLVEPDRLRFDFTHFEALTREQLAAVQLLVNSWILAGIPICTEVMNATDAKNSGATALFGEKYGDAVRVVSMGGASKELCGGTHLDNTAKAGLFRVMSEFSVASGVRRIEAVTGLEAISAADADRIALARIAAALKANGEDEIISRIEQSADELRQARRELESYAARSADADALEYLNSARDIGGVRVITAALHGCAPERLRLLGDKIRDRDAGTAAVFGSVDGEKLTFLAVCGKDAVARGVRAGDIIKAVSAVAGGSGGGKPDSAMGGGRDISKLDAALASVDGFIAEKLK